jgi:hypothetical protein
MFRMRSNDTGQGSKVTFWSMIWIQSIICSLLFVVNFAWHPKHWAVAVALNILLASSCLGLLITSSRREIGNRPSEKREFKSDDIGRNVIVTSLVLLFFVASVLKLNGSSTALWRALADRRDPDAGVIAGTAKDVRSDEWLVQTPWIWSQAEQKPAFPQRNTNIGNDVAPLLTNLPARHWSMLFRPQMWGFFFLNRERAFSFNWNSKWFALLLSGFLFFRILARGNNFLALSGALILLFSSYIQWFFSTPTCMPEMIAMVFFALWALHTMRRAKSRWAIAGAGVVLLVAVEQFVFCCYPRFQIPLAYLAVALLVGGSTRYRNRNESAPETLHFFRSICLITVPVIAATLLWQWYREVSPAIKEIQSLIYPGQETFSGGSYSWVRLLAPFLEFSLGQNHYPEPLGNACEAAGFLFLAPLLAAGLIRDAWQRRADGILIAVVLFLAFAIWYISVGIPIWLARATGWSYVVSIRAILAVGVASIAGLVRHLALPRQQFESRKRSLCISALVLALFLFGCFYTANSRLGDFAKLTEVTAAAVFFATVFFLLWQRIRVASCILLLVPLLYASGFANPIARGVPGFTRSSVFHWLSNIHRRDPSGSWVVIGDLSNRNCCFAQFVKATGANVFGGSRCMPDREMLRVLDPENRYATISNRYARVCFLVSTESQPVFELLAADDYQVRLGLRSEIFESLGVRYIVLVDQKEIPSLPRFEPIGSREGLVVLRYR